MIARGDLRHHAAVFLMNWNLCGNDTREQLTRPTQNSRRGLIAARLNPKRQFLMNIFHLQIPLALYAT